MNSRVENTHLLIWWRSITVSYLPNFLSSPPTLLLACLNAEAKSGSPHWAAADALQHPLSLGQRPSLAAAPHKNHESWCHTAHKWETKPSPKLIPLRNYFQCASFPCLSRSPIQDCELWEWFQPSALRNSPTSTGEPLIWWAMLILWWNTHLTKGISNCVHKLQRWHNAETSALFFFYNSSCPKATTWPVSHAEELIIFDQPTNKFWINACTQAL